MALTSRGALVGACGVVVALGLGLGCSRIDDSDCSATRTCPPGAAGQGGAAGAADDSAASGGEQSGATSQ